MAARRDPSDLASWTWVDADAVAAETVLLVPVGSTEQHGPHLPLDTDTRITVAVATAVAQLVPGRCVVAPAVSFGASGEHAGFAGTLSIGHAALEVVLIELGRSADKFAGVVFVNGHGGNVQSLSKAETLLRAEGRAVAAWSWTAPGGDAHAGRTETSLLLAIEPMVVRLDVAAAGRTEPLSELATVLRSDGVRAVSPNGVLGDPAGASAEEGRELLERFVAELSGVVDRLHTGR